MEYAFKRPFEFEVIVLAEIQPFLILSECFLEDGLETDNDLFESLCIDLLVNIAISRDVMQFRVNLSLLYKNKQKKSLLKKMHANIMNSCTDRESVDL